MKRKCGSVIRDETPFVVSCELYTLQYFIQEEEGPENMLSLLKRQFPPTPQANNAFAHVLGPFWFLIQG